MTAARFPWGGTYRDVVDGIAMVLHLTRWEGRRFVEQALGVDVYDSERKQLTFKPVAFG